MYKSFYLFKCEFSSKTKILTQYSWHFGEIIRRLKENCGNGRKTTFNKCHARSNGVLLKNKQFKNAPDLYFILIST